MPEMIRDGTGKGYLTKVDEFNRLRVDAVTQAEEIFYNIRGRLFTINVGYVTLNSTNPHAMLYLKNNSTTENIYVSSLNIGWNGGDTNHNRCMRHILYKNPNAPTANHVNIDPGNLNWTSGSTAAATAYQWDGLASDGMTFTGGAPIFNQIWGQGGQIILVHGMPIIGANQSVIWSVDGEEIGTLTFAVRFFYKE